MAKWPEHVASAFEYAGYHNQPYLELAIEGFASRWNGLDIETFIRVLNEGQGEEILLAIFALGSTGTLRARELLLPFLYSSQPKERWASAFCLGKMKEDLALPVLLHLVTEFLPPYTQYTSEGYVDWFYESWRPVITRLLSEWVRPSLALPLLEALKELRRQDQAGSKLQRRSWRLCQKHLIYALGRLERFDLLADLEYTEEE